MILSLFKTAKWRPQARRLYTVISAVSREPGLYLNLGVPDTVEGRFESLSLHVSLVLRRLKDLPSPALDVSKDVVDFFFSDLDNALRELGVGDLSVGKKIKLLAQAFYGQAKVLETALQPGAAPDALEAALARNVLGLDAQQAPEDAGPYVVALAAYVREAAQLLASQPLDAILKAERLFPGIDVPVFSAAELP